MSDRPTEIWCDTGLYWEYKKDWSEGSWRDNDSCGGEKYVRADRIEELEAKLAKAVEDCANVARKMATQALTPAAREHAEQIAEAIIAELTGGEDA